MELEILAVKGSPTLSLSLHHLFNTANIIPARIPLSFASFIGRTYSASVTSLSAPEAQQHQIFGLIMTFNDRKFPLHN